MKKLLLAAALCLATAVGVHAQASATKTKTPSADPQKFTIEWFKPTNPDVLALQRQVEAVAQRRSVGAATQDEVEALRLSLEHAKNRTPYLLNIESRGGSLQEFAKVATHSDEMSLTIINAGEPSDLDTPIPPFTLRRAHWGTVVNVLATFLQIRGLELKLVGGDNPHLPDAKSIVCMLRRIEPAADEKKRTSMADFESIQLGEHIYGTQTIEVIVDAIRAAWEIDPAREPAALRLKFHPATKILLISGPSPAGHIARQVISGLRKNPVQR